MKTWLLLAVVLGTPPAWAHETAFGAPADARKAKRSIRVEMNDRMRFVPAEIRVKRGETVRFVAVNKGKVEHEFVLGTMDDLKQHAERMKQHPHMQHEEHDATHAVEVAPGKSGELGWQFTRAGEFHYGCLVPGHFEAGMVGRLIVTK
jgi:uncharacterized cupredoxin-like copper-binding protein